MALMPIGKILLEDGAITEEQLVEALEEQKKSSGKKLGDILIEKKYIDQKQFMKAFARKLSVGFVELNDIKIDEEVVKLIDEDLIKNKKLLPIKVDENKLTIATDNPLDFYQFDSIRLTTGFEVIPVLATTQEIKQAVDSIYVSQEQQKVLDSLNQDFSTEEIADLDKEIAELDAKIDSAPVVKLANTLIYDAYKSGASDVHIEPRKKNTRIRMRLDGELVEKMTISNAAHKALITRIKILSDLNIAEKRIPQDGRYGVIIDGNNLDLRVSTLPTIDGEKMVIRLLGSSVQKITKLDELGMSPNDLKTFESMLKNPNGIIVVTGPTGSGKSTTLYAALDKIATPNINVVTVEDPVEKNMEGINQVNINVKAGLTFAAGLRSILRQDPDVIMIGEMRDGETAEIAVRSAITGHLVLSTVHTNDAISTVSRLVDMGIEPYLVASSLVGVVAQRLVKICCPECAKTKITDESEMELLHINEPVEIKEVVGCEKCSFTGYKGRTAIYEMIPISKDIKRMITKQVSEAEMTDQAKKEGASFLRDSVIELVLQGVTDIRQLIRTTYTME